MISVDKYRRVTGDYDSTDLDIADALKEATADFEFQTGREFELKERTEKVRVNSSGYAYPKATPIVSIATPGVVSRDGIGAIVGYGINSSWAYWWDVRINWDGWSDDDSSTVDLTYTGGYEEIPYSVAAAIIEIAQGNLKPTETTDTVTTMDIPEGATSVSVGDLSIGFSSGYSASSSSGSSSYSSSVSDTINRWRRRF